MSMFPHAATVYSFSVETDAGTMQDTAKTRITVLRGVLLEPAQGISVRGVQLASADEAALYVPFNAEIVDGVTGEKTELDIRADGKTFFIKGVNVDTEAAADDLERKYRRAYQVTHVDELDFGGLPHWEIGGK